VPLLSSAPAAQKPATGDPTTALFAAINSNNYNGAQDAISRGADLTQQNTLGETPLDLSVALNRNSITFMLLGARNESAQAGGGAPMALPASAAAPQTHHHHKPLVQTTTPTATMAPAVPLNDPGTPNPQAGFLGFDTGK
jgi:ankyrin repeat protein